MGILTALYRTQCYTQWKQQMTIHLHLLNILRRLINNFYIVRRNFIYYRFSVETVNSYNENVLHDLEAFDWTKCSDDFKNIY